VSVQNNASPAPGQGVADRGARPGRRNSTRGPSRSAPFAALDHSIAGDPDVSPLGKAVLLALLFWAREKAECWPSDRSIGARVGRSVGTVQRTLRQLETLGLVIRERCDRNRTGRLIRLPWRSAGATPPTPRAREVATPKARDERDRIREGESLKETPVPSQERRRSDEPAPKPIPTPEPPASPPVVAAGLPAPASAPIPALVPIPRVDAPTTPSLLSNSIPALPALVLRLSAPEQARYVELSEANRARVLELLATEAPVLIREARRRLIPRPAAELTPESIPLDDLLRGLPGRPDRLATAAGRLARELGDHRSYQFYQSVAAAVCRRAAPAEALVMALTEGMNPMAKRPGAVFAHVWRRESSAV
jgi:hypothetical protein